MNKRNLTLSIICLLLAIYVLFAGKLYSDQRSEVLCHELDIRIADSVSHPYVHASEIRQLLLTHQIKIKDIPVDEVDLAEIEQTVEKHSLVKNAECYVSPAGVIRIDISQRIPILRVISGGEKFFVDEDGEQIAIPILAEVNVPVATGAINRRDSVVMGHLYEMALYLREDKFWDAMLSQLDVQSNGAWILYPRIGDFEIYFGKPQNIPYKMQSLRCFYEDALPKVGWNRYSRISLEYENQIICTKK